MRIDPALLVLILFEAYLGAIVTFVVCLVAAMFAALAAAMIW